jgi:hypothetical protein
MLMRVFHAAAIAALSLGSLTPAAAQVRASERGSVSQTVDGTVITVDYSRPRIRGRDSVFASKGKGVVYWGEVWTPGANWATTLDVSRPVKLNGHDVAAGKYSLWFIPQLTEWTVGLHPNPRRFHTQPPKDSEYVLTFKVPPRAMADSEDVLLFSFPRVSASGTTLRMQWAATAIEIDVAVQPSRPPTNMTEEQMAPYLGSYTMRMEGDTAEHKAEVLAAGQAIRVVVDGWGDFAIELVPTAQQHRFVTAFVQKGQLYDVEDQAPFVFDVANGRATGFTVIDATENKPWMTAKRAS